MIALFVVFSVSVATAARAKSPYPFEIEAKQQANEHVLIAKNRGPAPVSVRVELQAKENTTSDRIWPIYEVVPPERESPLARVFAREPAQGYSFGTRSTHSIGDYTATHNPNARYRMPYEDGQAFMIGQAPGGPITTHTTPESRFAVDIPMPQGTPVLAARDGVVIETEFGYISGGKEESLMTRANFVRVLHADGTIASYVHLAPGGVSVSARQRVRAGTQLGLSGSTGFSSGPHLHFAVSHLIRTDSGFLEVSVPITFYVGNPPHDFQPEMGLRVKAEYGSPAHPQPLSAAEREGLAAQMRASTEGVASAGPEAEPGKPTRAFEAPVSVRAYLMTWRWWQWLGLMLALWLLLALFTRRRSSVARREPYPDPHMSASPVRKTRPAEDATFVRHELSAADRLAVVCGGDRAKARRLTEFERHETPSIDDDEAARRALRRLINEQR